MSQKIVSILNKHELYYNSKKPIHTFKYDDQVVILSDNVVIVDKKKAVEMEKELFTNTNDYNIKISKPNFYQNDNIISCDYYITYFEVLKDEVQKILQKVAIKDVDMNALIDDLNKNGINVNQILMELQKHGKNLAPILDYLCKQNIDLTKLMTILFRNNITIPNLLKNPYIYDLLKQSPTYSWVIGKNEKPTSTSSSIPISDKKFIKKIHVYTIFKLKNDDLFILNINYTKL